MTATFFFKLNFSVNQINSKQNKERYVPLFALANSPKSYTFRHMKR